MRTLLDTNVLIDYLSGLEPARKFLEKENRGAVGLITWMEVMVGARHEEEARTLEAWLSGFSVLDVDAAVARAAVALRRKHRLRLPDAVIWATAEVHRLVLVTRNTRDFPADHPGVHVPYEI